MLGPDLVGEHRPTPQVGCGAESLFQDLDSLFSDSWARPGVDLKPEMA